MSRRPIAPLRYDSKVSIGVRAKKGPGVFETWWESPARQRFDHAIHLVAGATRTVSSYTRATADPRGRATHFNARVMSGSTLELELSEPHYGRIDEPGWNVGGPAATSAHKLGASEEVSGWLCQDTSASPPFREVQWFSRALAAGELLAVRGSFPQGLSAGYYARVDAFGPVAHSELAPGPLLVNDLLHWLGYQPGATEAMLSAPAAGIYSFRLESTFEVPFFRLGFRPTSLVVELFVETVKRGATQGTRLPNAWLYWCDSEIIQLFRTDADGRVRQVRTGADRTQPWNYPDPFTTNTGRVVKLAYSRGARPIPPEPLLEYFTAFVERTVTAEQGTARAVLKVPEVRVAFEQPAELAVWPLLVEPVQETYLTAGLPQGAAMWRGGALVPAEDTPSPPCPPAARHVERGLRVRGSVQADKDTVKLRLLDELGDPLQLKGAPDAAPTETLTTTVSAPNRAGLRRFETTVYLASPAASCGPVQLLVLGEGGERPLLASLAVALAGLGIELVADGTDGRTPGQPPRENDERRVADFLVSPQAAQGRFPNQVPTQLTAQTRGRRMIVHTIDHRLRPIPGLAQQVLHPEMPMFMAELHACGLTRVAIEDLLQRRNHRDGKGIGEPRDLALRIDWKLALDWDGPDARASNGAFALVQEVLLHLGADGRLTAVQGDGTVPGAFVTPPVPIAFPVANRRLPRVAVDQKRRFGREPSAPEVAGLLVEWQPALLVAGHEALRGGDGRLTLNELRIDGGSVDAGMVRGPAGPAPPPATAPDADLPLFRVRGQNPSRADVETLINALVEDHFTNQPNLGIQELTLEQWRITARLIIQHESHQTLHQYWGNAIGRFYFRPEHRYYGSEHAMPTMGPPHGYGLGQLDPPDNDEQVWSILANAREAIRRLMQDKGPAARTALRGTNHWPVTGDARQTAAIFRREVVRAYNGGREFFYVAGTTNALRINTRVAADRRTYPNDVLNTNINYNNMPAELTTADYGPGI